MQAMTLLTVHVATGCVDLKVCMYIGPVKNYCMLRFLDRDMLRAL